MLDVAALLRARGTSGARAARLRARGASAAAEERLEEVGERILIAEEILHLLFAHGPVASGPAHVDRPGSTLAAHVAERRFAARPALTRLRLFVHAPVRA